MKAATSTISFRSTNLKTPKPPPTRPLRQLQHRLRMFQGESKQQLRKMSPSRTDPRSTTNPLQKLLHRVLNLISRHHRITQQSQNPTAKTRLRPKSRTGLHLQRLFPSELLPSLILHPHPTLPPQMVQAKNQKRNSRWLQWLKHRLRSSQPNQK